jgi:hypothetical protein
LRIIKKVEGSIVNAAVFRCPADAKISFALVQPWKQISGAVKLRKLDLVRRLKKLTAEIILCFLSLASWKGLMMSPVAVIRCRRHNRAATAGGLRCRGRLGRIYVRRRVTRSALFQADESNAERLLLLVDITYLGGECPYDLLQTIKPADDVAHRGGHNLLP